MKKNRCEELLAATTEAMTAKALDKRVDIEIVKASDLKGVEYIPTGDPAIDLVFGGFPRGMFTCVYGGPGCGKTSKLLKAIGHQQRLGYGVFLEESEQSFSPKWAVENGVDLETLPMSQSTDLGSVLNAVVAIAKTGKCDIIYIDSLATLSPKEMRRKGVDEDDMAIVARRLGRFFQIAPETIAKTRTAVVFVTQKRDSLDMFSGGLEEYPGGNALKHQLALAINVRRAGKSNLRDKGERFNKDGDKIGFPSMWKCVKSKVDVTENTGVILDFFFGKGYDERSTVFELAMEHGIIEKAGAGKYQFMNSNGKMYKQVGTDNVLHDIRTDDQLYAHMISALRARCRPGDFTSPPSEIDSKYEDEINTEIMKTYELKNGGTDGADEEDKKSKKEVQEVRTEIDESKSKKKAKD